MYKNLKHIKSTGFKTPKKYFDNLEDKIMQSLALDETLKSSKNTGFSAPEYYFGTLEDRILNSISQKNNKTKVIKLPSKQHIIYALSVAATIIILLAIFIPNQPSFENLNNESVENYMYEEALNNEDLAALFSLEELNNLTITDQIYTDESLQNYILENASIEDLIIE